ncbi:MAG: MarR family transcriptional regulator [Aquabacterium sp.]
MSKQPHPPKKAPGAAPIVPTSAAPAGDTDAGVVQFYQHSSYNRENSYGYLMKRITQVMIGEVDKRLGSHGLTQAQWAPLFLIHQKRASTLAELSRELQVDAGALTRTLDRLEAKGLCKRERSTEDRRVVHLALTPEGKAATAPVPEVLCNVSNMILKGFTEEEWQTLMGLLRRLHTNAEALRDTAERDEPA